MSHPSHPNAAGGASLPPLTDDEKHDAFEWLREFALSTQPGARKAYIALREWSDLKSARSESVDDVQRRATNDADRYRFLRNFVPPEDYYAPGPRWTVAREQRGMGEVYRGKQLDAAIDAAIKEVSDAGR